MPSSYIPKHFPVCRTGQRNSTPVHVSPALVTPIHAAPNIPIRSSQPRATLAAKVESLTNRNFDRVLSKSKKRLRENIVADTKLVSNTDTAILQPSIQSADPSIIQTVAGFVAVQAHAGKSLSVRIAKSLEALATAPPVMIWTDTAFLGEVWAPEIVCRSGRYQVFFTAGVGSSHRMYVMHSEMPDSAYSTPTEVILPDNAWAIDGVPVVFEGSEYFIWSGWQSQTDVQQDIFIAKVRLDGRVQPPRVKIASPDQLWANIGAEVPAINEGPQPIIDPAGQLHVIYSANGSWGEDYCLADVRLKQDGDPLDSSAWFSSKGCLFGANPDTLAPGATLALEAKGVGHNSFVLKSTANGQPSVPPGTMPFVYHGVPIDEEPIDFWAARRWFLGTFKWVPDVAYGSGHTEDVGWSLAISE